MHLTSIYSTPLWQSEYPDFDNHKQLFLNAIKIYREKNPSKETPISNVFGYQSPDNLQEVLELFPLFEYICHMASISSKDLDFIDCDIVLTEAWLNVNDNCKCMNAEHVHRGIFSGVFYLSAPEGSGKLVLRNPGINRMWDGCILTAQKNQFTGEAIRIEPIEGNILLFPSYLPHSVETNDHDEERISISFNLNAFPKGSFEYSQNSINNTIDPADLQD